VEYYRRNGPARYAPGERWWWRIGFGDARHVIAVWGRLGVRSLPSALIALRLLCAGTIIVAAQAGASGRTLTVILIVAFLSDVFDGVIARRLGIATENLRRADTAADTVFYLAAAAAVFLRAPEILVANLPFLMGLVFLELSRAVLERRKFGRLAAYHLWSAKAWGVSLLFGFTEAFLTGRPGPLFRLSLWVGILSDLEGLSASMVLSRWHHDVPSAFHALVLERRR
jgi:phosphatidylglycerophosphate synthase